MDEIFESRVVGYEFFALTKTYILLGEPAETDIRSAVLDACLVHARCCTEFLVGRLKTDGTRTRNRNDVKPPAFSAATGPQPRLQP